MMDDDDNRRIISNYIMTVLMESSMKFDVLLQDTGYRIHFTVFHFAFSSDT